MRETFDTILFDLDGTLTDSSEGMLKGLEYALSKYGITMPEAERKRFIGPPLDYSFQNYCSFPYEQAIEARGHFREYYAKQGWKENRPYDGIRPLLEALRKQGKNLAVATSKNIESTERILKEFDLYDCFDAVSASPVDGSRTSKECRIEEAISQLKERGCTVKNPVLIGDTKFDVLGAANYGIPCIYAAWGFGDEKELPKEGILATVSTVEELQELLEG